MLHAAEEDLHRRVLVPMCALQRLSRRVLVEAHVAQLPQSGVHLRLQNFTVGESVRASQHTEYTYLTAAWFRVCLCPELGLRQELCGLVLEHVRHHRVLGVVGLGGAQQCL